MISGEIPADTLHARLRMQADVALDVRRTAGDARHDIELRADPARLDLRSLYLLLREALGGSPVAAHPTYDEYRAFQRELLRGPDSIHERQRWHVDAGLEIAGHRLFGQRVRRDEEPARVSTIERHVPDALATAVRELTTSREWEPAALWLTAWTIVLSRRTGERELLIRVGVDGRNYEELVDAIGPFARDVPLRCVVDESARATDLIGDTSAAYQRAWSNHEHYDSDRDARRSWPFGFEHQAWPGRELVGERDCKVIEATNAAAHAAEARLCVQQMAGGTRAALAYDASVHVATTMERLLDGCLSLIAEIVDRPDLRIAEVDHRSEAERTRSRAIDRQSKACKTSSSSNASDMTPDSCIHHWIERVAATWPDAPAVSGGGQIVSYADLNARANRLARYLIDDVGVTAEARIGLCLPRGPEMVSAMLAVWKAGAAFVPIDDEWPSVRALSLLTRTQALAVIADTSTAHKFEAAGIPVVDIAREAARIDRHDPESVRRVILCEQIAYVLFTSGSTGEPKGVAVEHRQLVHYTEAIIERLCLQPCTTFAMVTTAAADLGYTALLGALCSGGCLEWIDRQTATDAAALDAYCRERPMDAAKMTPSHVRALLSGATRRPAWLPRDLLVLGGETLDASLVKRLRHWHPTLRVVNHYGPTETTIGVLAGVADADVAGDVDTVALGAPLGETQAWIAHAGGALAGIGEVGELWIGGPGVSRGYWNDPALTADRFRPDPYGGLPGARLYRTGDLARVRDDDGLEYVGRADDQVKVRGYRVEPAEVAHAIRAMSGIREAAVIARRDSASHDVQLIAYIVADENAARVQEHEWRAALEQRLPSHMVPTHWVRIDQLPLLPNGKLDRAALPEPIAEATATDSTRPRRPLTPTEDLVAAVWAAVLDRSDIGPDDHFFVLGGDSIRSLRVLSLLQGRGLDVGLQLLASNPVLCALARAIDERAALHASQPSSSVADVDADPAWASTDCYPLTRLQLGMVYHIDLTPDASVYHDISSIHLRLPFDREALQASLQIVADRHAVLRTSLHLTHGDGPVQRVHSGVTMALDVADWRGVAAGEQESRLTEWIEIERRTPFDVSRAPLIRFAVHLRSDDTFQFSSTCHHAILDGWSSTIMRTELLQDYARRVGLPLPALLDAPPDVFREYVRLERAASQSESSRTFWRERLDGAEPSRLPRAAVAQPLEPDTSCLVSIPDDVWRTLADHARHAALPLRIVLLAAHLRVCALLGGRIDAISGVVSNGRPETFGSDRALGLFLNTLPLRLEAGWQMTWRDLCEAVLARELEISPHRRVPLADIQQIAGAGGPLFEAVFNFIDFHEYGGLLRVAGDRFLGSSSFSRTHFDLLANFGIDPVSRQPGLELQFRGGRFSRAQIETISSVYQRTLASLASAGLDGVCQARGLLPEVDVSIMHGGRSEGIRDLVWWLDAHAATRPDDPAVVLDSHVMTYGTLRARVATIACALRARGVARGALVYLCFDRGSDFVAAVVATLAVGAAYVPVDPSLPEKRIHAILAHARCQVVVTSDEHVGVLPLSCDRLLLSTIATNATSLATDASDTWRIAADPDDLAYVIYTSGSTGAPKGVAMTRRATMTLVEWQLAQWRPQPAMRTLLLASPGFDVSFQEIFCTLATGGTLYIVPESTKRDPDALWLFVADACIERIFAPPVIVQALADAAARVPRPIALREIIAAGEALRVTTTARAFLSDHGIRLFNHYGPTETHVVSAFALEGAADDWPLLPPIGTPIAGSGLAVLDVDRQPVPLGVTGELYAAGACLARGYLHDPALTAERFVPDPLSRIAGARMYRTGDVAVCRDDRLLEYVGRADGQVKIRGYRVEIGDVEAALLCCASVTHAAATPRRSASGHTELWAFIVTARNETTNDVSTRDVSSVLDELRTYLPLYMLPARTAIVDRLPMLPNGKVDRRQLASWSAPESAIAAQRLPVSAGERIVADTIASLLELDRIGLDDDVFEIGGNSLTAVQIAVRLRDLFGCTLPLSTLYGRSTVAGVYEAIAGEIGVDRLEGIADTMALVDALSEHEVEKMLKASGASA